MKVVYIAGKFRGNSAWEVELNIREAEELAFRVWKAGYVALCPHTNTRFFDGALPNHVWLDGDIELLKRCDALITATNWESSSGAKAEVAFAQANNIPVVHTLTELIEVLI